MVADRGGDDAEPALEVRKVLVVVAEDEAREPVVLEGERDLGPLLDDSRRNRPRRPPLRSRRGAVRWPQVAVSHQAAAVTVRSGYASAPNKLFDPVRSIWTATTSPAARSQSSSCTAWRYGDFPAS